jgi:hypothetical protein
MRGYCDLKQKIVYIKFTKIFSKKLSPVYKHNKNILICNSAGGFGGLQDPSGSRKFGSGT